MHQIIGHFTCMISEIVEKPTYRVAMHVNHSFRRSNSSRFCKLFADLLDFSLTQFLVVKWSSFCLDRISMTMKAIESLMTCSICSTFYDIFVFLSSIKRTIVVLTNIFNFTPRSCQEDHLFAKKDDLLN